MKSKTKTYVLLVFVLGIWGVIGYRIISFVNPKAREALNNDFDVAFSPKVHTEQDTFSIELVNRDPFLGKLYVKKKTTVKKSKKVEVEWAPITYHGSINNQSGKNKVFIVSINKKQFLMKLGQIIDNIKLIKGDKNNITVSYKGQTKRINKT